jgi:predicted ATPase
MLSELEILELLGSNPNNCNRAHLDQLTTQLSTGGIIPFVGAGMSKPFGFPLWDTFLLEVAGAAHMTDRITALLDTIPPQYEDAASELCLSLGSRRFQDFLAAHFGDHVISGKHLVGAITELVNFPSSLIITTNFDCVLENVFKRANKKLTPCFHPRIREGHEHLQKGGSPLLLKLHGDWSELGSRILTNDEYREAYGDERGTLIDFRLPIPTLLFTVFTGRCCLFLGCSLRQDRTVQLLQRIAEGVKKINHYAIVEEPSSPEELAKRSDELQKQSICPIWYPHGKHDRIKLLLSYLSQKARDGLQLTLSKQVRENRPNGSCHSIPDRGNDILGRETEIQQVSQMLLSARCVTITGVGGCGKSRLAIEVAHTMKDCYEDGIGFISLADLAKKADKERVLASRIGRVIGVPEQAGRPPHEALAEHLAASHYLLVLDNCEHLINSCREIIGYLLHECNSLTILTTSRRPITIRQERLYPLAPLATPDPETTDPDEIRSKESVRLFVQRAEMRSPGYAVDSSNAVPIATICRALDGIPLAIEVAAARLGVLSVEEMSHETRDLLNKIGNLKSEELRRWKTLPAALRWSYSLLNHDQQAFMRSLAIFDGGWTAKSADAVYPRSTSDSVSALDHLQSLYDNSLVVAAEVSGAKRFRFLEPVRQLAVMQMNPAERAEYECRHARLFLHIAEEAAPEILKGNQVFWLDKLQVEVDNFRAASRWAVESGNAEVGMRLFAALWRFIEIRGGLAEGRTRAAEVLGIANVDQLPELKSRVLSGAGMLAYRQADFDDAERMFGESLEIEEQLQNQRGIANALNDLGNVANRKKAYDRARSLYSRSLKLNEETGDRRGMAATKFNLGDTALYLGDYEEARRLFEESVHEFEEEHNERDSAFPRNGLAQAAIAVQNLTLASEHGNRSLAIRQRVNDPKGIGDTLRTLAWISIEVKDFAQAKERLSQSLTFTSALKDLRGIADALDLFALLYSDLGRPLLAIRLFAAAAKLRGNLEYAPKVRVLRRESALAQARDLVGEHEYAANWQYGTKISSSDALDLAERDADSRDG